MFNNFKKFSNFVWPSALVKMLVSWWSVGMYEMHTSFFSTIFQIKCKCIQNVSSLNDTLGCEKFLLCSNCHNKGWLFKIW